ncbi:hypothetical protein [Hydrocarboniphaga effusa]|uniref:hypothetical protein n=1 Tax=Hydrocarboniphaga effusa TaxID=243629 RepID=UPI003137AC71
MIAEFYLEPEYWVAILGGLGLMRLLMPHRLLDFTFFSALYLTQFTVHIALVPGLHRYLLFCLVFVAAVVLGYRWPRSIAAPVSNPNVDLDQRLILFCKAIIILYYIPKLIMQPPSFSALELGLRLEGQQQNKLLFFMGLAMLGPTAAWVYDWVQRGRATLLDLVILVLVGLGALASGSKASVLPMLLAVFGASSYLGTRSKIKPSTLWTFSIGAAVVMALMLGIYFPLLSPLDIGDLILYRLAANTDSLEYLYAVGAKPEAYPFAGIGALNPFLGKILGTRIDYSIGVWLHGIRYDNWTGFGPNPGFVIDYFGNLGWFGIYPGLVIGLLLKSASRAGNVVGCMYLSFSYFALVESTIFYLNILLLVGLYGAAYASVSYRPGRPLPPEQQIPVATPNS